MTQLRANLLKAYCNFVYDGGLTRFVDDAVSSLLLDEKVRDVARKSLHTKGFSDVGPNELVEAVRIVARDVFHEQTMKALEHSRVWSISTIGTMVLRALIRRSVAIFSRRFLGDSRYQRSPEPPALAEFVVGVFALKRYREGILSDLEESFAQDLQEGKSARRARVRYWARALSSIGPQVWAAAKRVGFLGLIFR